MGLKPLPSLFVVFSMVKLEESRRHLTQGNQTPVDGLALVIRGPQTSESSERKGNKWCNHCNKKGHTRDECWKLHGKPTHGKQQQRRDGKSHHASSEERGDDGDCLTREELQMLRKMLERQNSSKKVPNVNLIQSRNSVIALNAMVTSDETWIVDSGATDHMTGTKSLFKTLNSCHENLRVKVATGLYTKVEGVGTVALSDDLEIHNVLFVPALTYNLISDSILGRKILTTKEWDRLYYFEGKDMKKKGARKAMHIYKPTNPFTMIHTDIWGPARTKTRTGTRWFITFIDDHTRVTWVYLMKEKSETLQIFKNFHSFVKTQFQTPIKVLRSDNAKEYVSGAFREFLEEQGIHHQTLCVYTPQQNGVAEWKNRHLLEVTRAIMMERNVPSMFWGDAVLTVAYLINRMASKIE
ncbi:uncharacterized protein LOC114754600 [Neltuma alba]|uniref:uncharacterized protein LOC114754600 n=1 Tax=Neltuma alba TaxID=207710 RepID=UPI0010A2E7EF|nr:uncharacterized protein LOC114754600 [Prosopis alba]